MPRMCPHFAPTWLYSLSNCRWLLSLLLTRLNIFFTFIKPLSRPSPLLQTHCFQFDGAWAPTSPFAPLNPLSPFSPFVPSRPGRPGNPGLPGMPGWPFTAGQFWGFVRRKSKYFKQYETGHRNKFLQVEFVTFWVWLERTPTTDKSANTINIINGWAFIVHWSWKE